MIVLRHDHWTMNPGLVRALLLAAHVAALIALSLGLIFLLDTTGGTLFLFSAAGPVLVILSLLIVLGVAIDRFRARHSLFDVLVYQAGEEIMRQDDDADCAYFIQSGEVEVNRQVDGTREKIATLTAGQYFGEMALLSNERRNATVRAVSRTRVARLGRTNFLAMLQALPATQDQILKTVQERAMRLSVE